MRSIALAAMICSLLAAFAGLAVMASTRRWRLELERHVNLVVEMTSAEPSESVRQTFPRAFLARFEVQIRRLFMFGVSNTWGVRAGAPLLLALSALSGGSAWLVAHVGLHFAYPTAALAAIVAALLAPRALIRRQQSQAERQFLDQFPEAIDMIVRMLQAGIPMSKAIRVVATESSPPISAEFGRLSDRLEIGVAMDEALAVSGKRIRLADFSYFVVAVTLQQSTGGNFVPTLSTLADFLRKRHAARLRTRAVTAEVRMSAIILGTMPFVAAGALLITSPNYLAPLIYDPRGNVILGMTGCSLLLAFLSMRSLVRSVTSMA